MKVAALKEAKPQQGLCRHYASERLMSPSHWLIVMLSLVLVTCIAANGGWSRHVLIQPPSFPHQQDSQRRRRVRLILGFLKIRPSNFSFLRRMHHARSSLIIPTSLKCRSHLMKMSKSVMPCMLQCRAQPLAQELEIVQVLATRI